MARTGARPGDWKTEPLSERTAPLSFARSFSARDFQRLQQGLVPEQMEDKWFIVWHDDALWFHRSWTGFCVYRLRFKSDGEHVVVTDAIANRDPEEYRGNDEHDVRMLDDLLAAVLRYAR